MMSCPEWCRDLFPLITIYVDFILLLIICYMLFVIDNVQFQASCDRARLLAAQIMLLHVGAQPPPHSRRGIAPTGADRLFSRAECEIPEYRNMLRNVLKLVTSAERISMSSRIDDLIDDRNCFSHPLNDALIISEAQHVVYALNVFWRRPRLKATDCTALVISSNCAEILAAPRPRI